MSRFKSMVTDGISSGLSPRQAIADALDYGVRGMKKGQHKAPSSETHAYNAGRPSRPLNNEEKLARTKTGSQAWREEVMRQNLEKRRSIMSR